MKNKTLVAFALLVASSASAQVPTGTGTTTTTTSVATDVIIPEHLKGLTTETLRPEHSFPVLGTYKASGTSVGDITITQDESNKGIVWVEGFSQGRFKALMKKAPSTYKIPAQKTESGKAVAEGTLFLNPESKELTILLGRPFNDWQSFLVFPQVNHRWSSLHRHLHNLLNFYWEKKKLFQCFLCSRFSLLFHRKPEYSHDGCILLSFGSNSCKKRKYQTQTPSA